MKPDLTKIQGQFYLEIQHTWMFGNVTIRTKPISNMIVDGGLGMVISKIADEVNAIAIGTGTTETTLADTSLETETVRETATATEYPTYVEFRASFSASDLNGTTEVGLVTTVSPPGVLITRTNCPALSIPENLMLSLVYPIGFIPGENTTLWTLTSGRTYTYEKARINPVDGVIEYDTKSGYLPVSTVSQVEATPASYYHDTSANKLYVHTSDGENPNTTPNRQIIVLSGEG